MFFLMTLLVCCAPAAFAASNVTEPAGPSSAVTGPPAATFYQPQSLRWSLFNTTASFLGVPGLVSPVDGLQDEGLGFHADGTTRRVGGADAATGSFSGQRAAAYARSGWALGRQDWLYDEVMGVRRDAEGRALRFGSEHSGRRNSRYGQSLFGDNFSNSLLQRGLSAGMGFANSAVESSILGLMGNESPYGNGKARLNFMWHLDDKGKSRFGGEGDVLWPLYDSLHTTVYTQVGARSMNSGGSEYGPDRWIGNIGVGQRWFPAARLDDDGKVDSGNWMVGYNAFYDHDFSRGHQRGGVGLEAQYDWLKVSTNWYVPLSNWKDSTDFDGDYVRERAAQGWDVRARGYVPFYRELAVTGAFTQWYGDYVGLFGPSKLEKNPKVWSYGLEYTPVPAMTAYVNQRQSERGRSDTEFGLRLTYHFGMSAEEQFKPSRVAEMRTVHGSRHDFVDRENKIILEYQTKNKFHIKYIGFDGGTTFSFRLADGFGKPATGQVVRVTASGPVMVAAAPVVRQSFFAQALDMLANGFFVRKAHADSGLSYTTDGAGIIRVRVDNPGKLDSLSVSAGETTVVFTRDSMGLGPKVVADMQADKNELDINDTAIMYLKDAAYNADVQWKVEGIAPSAGSGSISGGNRTDDKGKATATFAALTPGAVSLIATVGGETIARQLTVKDNAYEVTASPTELTQHAPTSVTFTVKTKGTAVPVNTSVTFTDNANFTNLPTAAQNTDANGQITVSNLAAKVAGSQTVEITVDGQKATANFNVAAASYGLTASPTTLTQHAPKQVTFPVTSNGTAAPADVAVTFSANPNFTNLPTTAQTTNARGHIVVSDLTATVTGSQTLDIAVDGQKVTANLKVMGINYALTADSAILRQHEPKNVTTTVTRNGIALANTSVTFSANPNFTNLPTTEQTTDASGQIMVNDLTATVEGSQTVAITVDGHKTAANFNVVAASYDLTVSPSNLTQHAPTPVTFTVNRNGTALANTSVTFSANPNFINLPTTAQTTNASGQISLSDLTATATGSQTVEITVDGQTATAAFIVTGATYVLTATPNTLYENTATSVEFTLMRSGAALANTFVTLSGTSLTGLPSSVNTDVNGKFTVSPLTATATGTQTVTATADGQSVTTSFTVTPTTYALEATPNTLAQYTPTSVAFTVKKNGAALPNASVTFTDNSSLNLPTGALTTNASGQITVSDLTATATGSQTVEITVDGKTASVPLNVTPTNYSITASTDTLELLVTTSVTFTVKKNGMPLANSRVGFEGNFLGDLNKVFTDANGQFTIGDLMPLGLDSRLEIMVDGRPPMAVDFTILPTPVYVLEASRDTLAVDVPTSVTFTLTSNGTPLANTFVILFGSNFKGMLTVVTDGNGQFTISDFKAMNTGILTIRAEARNQFAEVSFTVNDYPYVLEANPATLRQHEAKNVVFTVLKKGSALAHTAVTFSTNPNFNLPTGVQTTNASGQITVSDLTATMAGRQKVDLIVDGLTATATFAVMAASYGLTASPSDLTQYVPTSVTFTLTRNGAVAPEGVDVTFPHNSTFINLPTTVQTTNASGQITVSDLTAKGSGTLPVDIVVDGQKVRVLLTVTPASYGFTIATPDPQQYVPTPVTFTVMRNGTVAPAGVVVRFNNNPDLNLPTTAQTTNASGQITVNDLTSMAANRQTVTIQVQTELATGYLNVIPASYDITIAPSDLTQYVPTSAILTVKYNGEVPPRYVLVNFDANPNFNNLPTMTKTTNASGQITVSDLTANVAGSQTIVISANGRTSIPINVIPASYVLTATPDTLRQYESKNVTFTVTRNGTVPPTGTRVTFTGNPNFTNLPTRVQTTNASGQISVSDLTATVAGSQTVDIIVDGQKATAEFNVTAAVYELIAVPDTLPLNAATSVEFTLTRDGAALKKTPVVLSGANFTGFPSSVTTDGNGKFTLDTLKGTAPGSQTVTATVEGQTVDVRFSINPSYTEGLTLVASTLTPGERSTPILTATVVVDGGPAPAGHPVTFFWVVKGGTMFPQYISGTHLTDANGQVAVKLPGTGEHRTLTVTASTEDGSTASLDVRFGMPLPPGFIVLSAHAIIWEYMESFCAEQGGRLPRANNSDWLLASTVITSIDGLSGGAWPSELPDNRLYWTGTRTTCYGEEASFYFLDFGGRVGAKCQPMVGASHVVCIP